MGIYEQSWRMPTSRYCLPNIGWLPGFKGYNMDSLWISSCG